jgi:hypothetical protein
VSENLHMTSDGTLKGIEAGTVPAGVPSPHLRFYEASPIKRRRATKAEMEERARFLIAYAREHGPVTVRGLYYQAEVHGIPGIDKTDGSYNKVQAQVLKLRRAGRMSYSWISDATRWMRKPTSFDSVEDALNDLAASYRRNLWRDADCYVEIWCEKDALAGTIYPVTSAYDVPLMVARGFSSETFCYEAVAARGNDQRPYVVYYLGDFDRAGRDAARSLHEKLRRFAREETIPVVFEHLAITIEQIEELRLPTRPHKRSTPSDRAWPHAFACELDAMPPDRLRSLVEQAINRHLSQDQLRIERIVQESQREGLLALAGRFGDDGRPA